MCPLLARLALALVLVEGTPVSESSHRASARPAQAAEAAPRDVAAAPDRPAADPAGLPPSGAREECGVVGVFAPGEDVATLIYFALYALQHRGQESAGIAASDGERIMVTKEMGLVNQAFDHARLAGLAGHLGVGHVRYSTTGASVWDNAQPAFKVRRDGRGIALGHNGNLVNTGQLARGLGDAGAKCTTDSEVLAELLASGADVGDGTDAGDGTGAGDQAGARDHADAGDRADRLDETIAASCAQVAGAYALVAMDERCVYAVRDPHGVRPLVMGRLPGGGWVIASESCALDILGAHHVGDVEPGELVAIDADGLRRRRLAEPTPHFCSFEYVYLARPDHRTDETTVAASRRRMGQLLAEAAPADADLVIPVPDSGVSAASGYSQVSGIPYAEGLVKNRYVGRTFIEPSQSLRQLGIRLKLNPLRDVLEGQRLVVVDDSIVRGNTSRQLVRMLRESGAREVHLRVSAPPIRHPCYYGIDMATRSELIASGLDEDGIRDFVGADSLAYLPLEALVEASGRPKDSLCRACFDGQYPIPVPGDATASPEPRLFEGER